MSSFATPAVAATSSTKDYNFEQVFYKAGLKLKGNDKYSAYVKHIENLLENIAVHIWGGHMHITETVD
jgi:hypothetical protein